MLSAEIILFQHPTVRPLLTKQAKQFYYKAVPMPCTLSNKFLMQKENIF